MPASLTTFLSQRSHRKLSWGEFDCCLAMSDWVRLRTGFDPMEGIRGTYRGWKQAAYTWRRLGGVEAAVSSKLDQVFHRVGITEARRGDVALAKTHHTACTCAIVDTYGLWMPTQQGYRPITRFRPVALWRIE